MGTDNQPYTLKYYIRISPARDREGDHTEKFEAENDTEAVRKGKELFIEKVTSGDIPTGSVLTEIYKNPENLLEKNCTVFMNGEGKIILKD